MLDEGLMFEINEIAKRYRSRCDHTKIICTSTWNAGKNVDYYGENKPKEEA
jgi:UDP-sulfoquinovose synthase